MLLGQLAVFPAVGAVVVVEADQEAGEVADMLGPARCSIRLLPA